MTYMERQLAKLPVVEGWDDDRYDYIVKTMGDHFEVDVIEDGTNRDGDHEKYYTAWKALEDDTKTLIWVVEINDLIVDWGFA